MPLAFIASTYADSTGDHSVHSHVMATLAAAVSDGSFTSAIQAAASRRRRLAAPGRRARRLSMTGATADTVVVATFSPTPVPSPVPTAPPSPAPSTLPIPLPTTPAPTLNPTPAPSFAPTPTPAPSFAPTSTPPPPTSSPTTITAQPVVPSVRPTPGPIASLPETGTAAPTAEDDGAGPTIALAVIVITAMVAVCCVALAGLAVAWRASKPSAIMNEPQHTMPPATAAVVSIAQPAEAQAVPNFATVHCDG